MAAQNVHWVEPDVDVCVCSFSVTEAFACVCAPRGIGFGVTALLRQPKLTSPNFFCVLFSECTIYLAQAQFITASKSSWYSVHGPQCISRPAVPDAVTLAERINCFASVVCSLRALQTNAHPIRMFNKWFVVCIRCCSCSHIRALCAYYRYTFIWNAVTAAFHQRENR